MSSSAKANSTFFDHAAFDARTRSTSWSSWSRAQTSKKMRRNRSLRYVCAHIAPHECAFCHMRAHNGSLCKQRAQAKLLCSCEVNIKCFVQSLIRTEINMHLRTRSQKKKSHKHDFFLCSSQNRTRIEMQQCPVSYTHLRSHQTVLSLVCRLLLENIHIS